MALRSQIFTYLLETFCRRALEYLQSARFEKGWKKCCFPTETPDHCRPFFLWSLGVRFRHCIAPVPGPEQNELVMSRSSTVNSSQYDAEYVTLEYLLHASFVGEIISEVYVEPARSAFSNACPNCTILPTLPVNERALHLPEKKQAPLRLFRTMDIECTKSARLSR